jgi:hypothetical protein
LAPIHPPPPLVAFSGPSKILADECSNITTKDQCTLYLTM